MMGFLGHNSILSWESVVWTINKVRICLLLLLLPPKYTRITSVQHHECYQFCQSECVHVHVHVCTCVHWGQGWFLVSSEIALHFIFLRQSLWLARLDGQQASGIFCLCPTPRRRLQARTLPCPAFFVTWVSKLRSSCCRTNSYWVLFSALSLFLTVTHIY